MDQMKVQYEERINFTILRAEEEKVELRQKYQEDAKIVIMAEISEKEKEAQQKHLSQELLLEDNKKKLTLFKNRCEEK
jgi:alanine racemase